MIKAYVLLPTYDFNDFYKYFDQTYLLKDIGNQLVFFTKYSFEISGLMNLQLFYL